jgi:hypothetical protein
LTQIKWQCKKPPNQTKKEFVEEQEKGGEKNNGYDKYCKRCLSQPCI